MAHQDDPRIAELLTDAQCLHEMRIGKGKQSILCSTYATKSGIVEFRDYQTGGWTMLTECPSGLVSESAAELLVMQSGQAKPRTATHIPAIPAIDSAAATTLTKPIADLIDQLISGRPATGLMAIEAEQAVEKIIEALTQPAPQS